jgi:hypothetical protein
VIHILVVVYACGFFVSAKQMPGMNSNEEEPQFTDSKEEAKYWRNLAEEYSSRSVLYSVISHLSFLERI